MQSSERIRLETTWDLIDRARRWAKVCNDPHKMDGRDMGALLEELARRLELAMEKIKRLEEREQWDR